MEIMLKTKKYLEATLIYNGPQTMELMDTKQDLETRFFFISQADKI